MRTHTHTEITPTYGQRQHSCTHKRDRHKDRLLDGQHMIIAASVWDGKIPKRFSEQHIQYYVVRWNKVTLWLAITSLLFLLLSVCACVHWFLSVPLFRHSFLFSFGRDMICSGWPIDDTDVSNTATAISVIVIYCTECKMSGWLILPLQARPMHVELTWINFQQVNRECSRSLHLRTRENENVRNNFISTKMGNFVILFYAEKSNEWY